MKEVGKSGDQKSAITATGREGNKRPRGEDFTYKSPNNRGNSQKELHSFGGKASISSRPDVLQQFNEYMRDKPQIPHSDGSTLVSEHSRPDVLQEYRAYEIGKRLRELEIPDSHPIKKIQERIEKYKEPDKDRIASFFMNEIYECLVNSDFAVRTEALRKLAVDLLGMRPEEFEISQPATPEGFLSGDLIHYSRLRPTTSEMPTRIASPAGLPPLRADSLRERRP